MLFAYSLYGALIFYDNSDCMVFCGLKNILTFQD